MIRYFPAVTGTETKGTRLCGSDRNKGEHSDKDENQFFHNERYLMITFYHLS